MASNDNVASGKTLNDWLTEPIGKTFASTSGAPVDSFEKTLGDTFKGAPVVAAPLDPLAHYPKLSEVAGPENIMPANLMGVVEGSNGTQILYGDRNAFGTARPTAKDTFDASGKPASFINNSPKMPEDFYSMPGAAEVRFKQAADIINDGQAKQDAYYKANPGQLEKDMAGMTLIQGFNSAPEYNKKGYITKAGSVGTRTNGLGEPLDFTTGAPLDGFNADFAKNISQGMNPEEALKAANDSELITNKATALEIRNQQLEEKANQFQQLLGLKSAGLDLAQQRLSDKEADTSKADNLLYRKTVAAQKEIGDSSFDWEHPDVQKALSQGHTPTDIYKYWKQRVGTM